jgi:glutamate dehydrogenase
VEDWPKIVEVARATIGEMKARETSADGVEARAFLEWMVADHFTFLGHRDYELITQDSGFALRGVPGSGAGLLR